MYKRQVSLPAAAANYLESGGNNLFTMFELASWAGAASETIAPYETASTVPSLNSSLAYEDTAHLQNARFVSTADLNSVKKLIMEYGAVSSAFYYDSRYLSSSSSYYYPKVASVSYTHLCRKRPYLRNTGCAVHTGWSHRNSRRPR